MFRAKLTESIELGEQLPLERETHQILELMTRFPKRSVQNFSFSLQNPSSTCYYWWILKSQGFCSKVTKLFMNHTKNWAELLWDHHYKWWISSTSLLVAITANCSLATNSRKFVQKKITHIKNPTLFSFPK